MPDDLQRALRDHVEAAEVLNNDVTRPVIRLKSEKDSRIAELVATNAADRTKIQDLERQLELKDRELQTTREKFEQSLMEKEQDFQGSMEQEKNGFKAEILKLRAELAKEKKVIQVCCERVKQIMGGLNDEHPDPKDLMAEAPLDEAGNDSQQGPSRVARQVEDQLQAGQVLGKVLEAKQAATDLGKQVADMLVGLDLKSFILQPPRGPHEETLADLRKRIDAIRRAADKNEEAVKQLETAFRMAQLEKRQQGSEGNLERLQRTREREEGKIRTTPEGVNQMINQDLHARLAALTAKAEKTKEGLAEMTKEAEKDLANLRRENEHLSGRLTEVKEELRDVDPTMAEEIVRAYNRGRASVLRNQEPQIKQEEPEDL